MVKSKSQHNQLYIDNSVWAGGDGNAITSKNSTKDFCRSKAVFAQTFTKTQNNAMNASTGGDTSNAERKRSTKIPPDSKIL